MIKKIGELDDWGDGDLGNNDFMKFDEGSNPIRVFTKPYQFYTIWTTDATGKQRKFRSAVENCPLVKRGEKPSARWYVGALNRKSNKAVIVEIGPQIFKQILGLRKKEKWGDPRSYDLDIERQPKGSQPLYIVSPEPKTPITDDEKGIIREFLGRVDLVKMSAAPTAEEVLEQMGITDEPKVEISNDFDEFTTTTESTDENDFDFSDV